MRISWKWLSEMVDLSSLKSPQELAKVLTNLGLEVESLEDLSLGLEKVVTAQVRQRDKHPDADRLSVCKVDDGLGNVLDIVCGAQNFKAGDKVVLAQIGASLPNGVTIKEGKIRGALSQGMLCSAEELKISASSDGIMILPADTVLGKNAAAVLGRQDVIFELGITPNRGDCLSHYGVARELSAYLGKPLRILSAEKKSADFSHIFDKVQGCKLKTEVQAGHQTPQFLGATVSGVKVGPSPAWMVQRLQALGARSINNVVDASNWVLYELGQPTHAYDLSKLEGKSLKAGFSRAGESLPLLDGTVIELTGKELVISDDRKAVALAGVMGGGNSEVTEGTTELFLECAEFDPVLVRQSAQRFVKHSDSSQRFEKGIDPTGQLQALQRLASLITEVAGGKVTGFTATFHASRSLKAKDFKQRTVDCPEHFIAQYLGHPTLKTAEIKKILLALGCEISSNKGKKTDVEIWQVTVPAHRWDLSIKEDLAEEVGRFIGYDHLPARIPALTSAPHSGLHQAARQGLSSLDQAKNALSALGLHETVQFSFTSRQWLAKCGMQATVAVRNPLSEDQEVMVPSLLPGLLQSAQRCHDHYFGSEDLALRLFELRPTFHFSGTAGAAGIEPPSRTETGIVEKWKLSILLSGPRYAQALSSDQGLCDFFDLKSTIETFFTAMGTKGVRWQALSESSGQQASNEHLYHPGKSARIFVGKDAVGVIGAVHPKIQQALRLKIKAPLWIAELDWAPIQALSRSLSQSASFSPWSEYPTIERDFALLVKDGIEAEKICQIAAKAGKPLAKDVRIFDTYKGNPVPEGMTSVAVRVVFSEMGRSLQENEADQASQKILAQWKSQLGIELRN